MTTTPASLLERLRQPGEQEAWGQFVELYTPLLYYWTRRMGLDPADAADLVQDVFTVLVQKLPAFHYDRARSFRAWLRTVTFNKWRESLRRIRVQSGVNPAALAEITEPESPDPFWEVEYRQHLVSRALQVMQRHFQPTTWKACWEVVVQGRPAAEVAAELQISVNSVRAAKCRVLCHLRRELDGLLT